MIVDMIHLHLQEIMDEKKLTPKDIAPYMKISERTIYRTIRAQRCPTLVDLVCFSAALKTPIMDLFTIESDGYEIRVESEKEEEEQI